MTGQLVAGRYRLGLLIGRGGSADVYAAVDELLERAVAVKIVRATSTDTPDPMAGVRAAARLRHPRIVATLDAGRTPDGRPFVVLDLVDGITLDALLGLSGAPSTHDALTIVGAVLDALAYAHEHGVLHLDVSPSNVMVAVVDGGLRPSETVVLDLAGSRAPAPGDRSVTVSPDYAAPEIATATAADERSDVYSVGALLFLLLTGHPLFEQSDPVEVLRAQVDQSAPRPSDRVSTVPPAVDRIVARALAKDPAARYPSARAMRVAVDLARDRVPEQTARVVPDGSPGVAPRVTTKPLPVVRVGPAGPLARRRSRAPILASVLVASAIVAGVALLRPAVDQAQGAPESAMPSATADAPSAPPSAPSSPATVLPLTAAARDVVVPTLVGLDRAAAQAALLADGLLGQVVAETDSAAVAATVLGVAPAEGSTVPAGAVVRLTVASGFTFVPTVIGELPESAGAALTAAGLTRDRTEITDPSQAASPGTVLRTLPAVGSRVELGTPVTLVLALAATPTELPTPSPTATGPTPSPSAVTP